MLKGGSCLVCFLLFVFVPWPFSQSLIEPSQLPRFLFLSVAGLAMLTASFGKRVLFPAFPVLFAILFYYGINLISSAWSLSVAESMYSAQKVFSALLVLVIALNFFSGQGNASIAAGTMAVSGFVFCLVVMAKLAMLPSLHLKDLYTVTIFHEHRNLISSALFLFMGVMIYAAVTNLKGRIFFLTGAGLCFLTIMLLGVRSVYVALLVSVALFIVFTVVTGKATLARISMAIIIIAVIATGLIKHAKTDSDLETRPDLEPVTSVTERLQLWKKTLYMVMENPVQGVGAGNWQLNHMKKGMSDISNVCSDNITFQHPHNDLLSILSETGILGLAPILFILAFVAFHACKFIIKKKDPAVNVLFIILCGLFAESCFSFPKERFLHIGLAAILFALLLHHMNLRALLTQQTSVLVSITFILITGFSVIVGSMRLNGEWHLQRLLSCQANNDVPGVIRHGRSSNSVFYQVDPTSSPLISYLGWAYDKKSNNDSLLICARKAVKLSPYDHETLNNLGYALNRAHDFNGAGKALEQAHRINPCYEPTILNMVEALYKQQNYMEALDWLSRVKNYQSRYPNQVRELESRALLPK